jgi:hypothetical protein
MDGCARRSGRWLGYLLVLVMATFVPRLAAACSCEDPPEDLRQAVSEAHARAKTVFVGRLVRSNDHGPVNRFGEERRRKGIFEFEIIEVYKGKLSVGQRVRVWTLMGEPCGFGLGDKRETWLIYARTYRGQLNVAFCSRSWLLARRQSDIPILAELAKDGAPPTIQSGRCTLGDDHEHGFGTLLILAGLLAARSRRRS